MAAEMGGDMGDGEMKIAKKSKKTKVVSGRGSHLRKIGMKKTGAKKAGGMKNFLGK